MVIAVFQVTLSVLIALFLLRTAEVLLLRRNPGSALGHGLAYIIG